MQNYALRSFARAIFNFNDFFFRLNFAWKIDFLNPIATGFLPSKKISQGLE